MSVSDLGRDRPCRVVDGVGSGVMGLGGSLERPLLLYCGFETDATDLLFLVFLFSFQVPIFDTL